MAIFVVVMISVYENYKLVQDLIGKNDGMFLSPDEYNTLAAIASDLLFDDFRGANTSKRVSYGWDRTLDSRLRPFRMEQDIVVIQGIGAYPTNWEQTLGVEGPGGVPIRPLDEDRASVARQDPYTRPDSGEVFYEDLKDGIRISDPSITTVRMKYLRRPVRAKYGYKLVDGRPRYFADNSVHFEWGRSMNHELAMRIVQLASLPIGDRLSLQYTQAKQQEE